MNLNRYMLNSQIQNYSNEFTLDEAEQLLTFTTAKIKPEKYLLGAIHCKHFSSY